MYKNNFTRPAENETPIEIEIQNDFEQSAQDFAEFFTRLTPNRRYQASIYYFNRRPARNLQSVVSASIHFLLGCDETLHLPARCQSQFQGITAMRRITILILIVGFIPSMKTAFLTDNYLSLFDLSFAFLCFLLGTAIQEALDRRCK